MINIMHKLVTQLIMRGVIKIDVYKLLSTSQVILYTPVIVHTCIHIHLHYVNTCIMEQVYTCTCMCEVKKTMQHEVKSRSSHIIIIIYRTISFLCTSFLCTSKSIHNSQIQVVCMHRQASLNYLCCDSISEVESIITFFAMYHCTHRQTRLTQQQHVKQSLYTR